MLQPPASRAPIPIKMPPSTAARAVFHGISARNFHAPAAAAASAAPIMMPMLVRLVPFSKIEESSACAFLACCQNSHPCTSTPTSSRSLAPHSANANVTPQILPEEHTSELQSRENIV